MTLKLIEFLSEVWTSVLLNAHPNYFQEIKETRSLQKQQTTPSLHFTLTLKSICFINSFSLLQPIPILLWELLLENTNLNTLFLFINIMQSPHFLVDNISRCNLFYDQVPLHADAFWNGSLFKKNKNKKTGVHVSVQMWVDNRCIDTQIDNRLIDSILLSRSS